ncbi:MAG: TatD family hydrolase [Anaerolineae bacterium]
MRGGDRGSEARRPNAVLTDTHAHLDAPAFSRDLEGVLARAQEAGVRAIVLPGLNLESSRQVIALAHRYPGLYAAVGLHPHETRTLTARGLTELESLAGDPSVVAVGEIGLDFYRNLSPRETQVWAFGELLALARRVEKPVIVHDREAHEEVLIALREHAQEPGFRGGVLHAFSGGLDMALQVMEWGYHVGVGGPVTYPKARRTREVAAGIPPSRLLLETDCPYLPPEPYRGRRNEPAYVALVAEAVAGVRAIAQEIVAEVTTGNACCLFGLTNVAPAH